MRSFVDNKGRQWTVTINVSTIKRVRALCNVDLYSLVEATPEGKADFSLLERLSQDPVLLVDVLFVICKQDADLRGVSDEEFGESMTGDTIEKAAEVFLDELVDFFPEVRRKVLNKILIASRKFEAAAKDRLEKILESKKFEEDLNSNLEKLISSSGNAPDTSELTPDPLH